MIQRDNMAVDCDQSLMDASRDNYLAAKERFLPEFNRAVEDMKHSWPNVKLTKFVLLIVEFCCSDVVKDFIYNGNPKEISTEAQWLFNFQKFFYYRKRTREGSGILKCFYVWKDYLNKFQKAFEGSIDKFKAMKVPEPYSVDFKITKDSSVEFFEGELEKRYDDFINSMDPFFEIFSSRNLYKVLDEISREDLTVLLGQCEECWQKLEKYCQVMAEDEVFIKDCIDKIYELRKEEKEKEEAKERERKQRVKEKRKRNLKNKRERERAAEQERLAEELKILRAEEEARWQVRKEELLESISNNYHIIKGELEEKQVEVKVLSKKVDEIVANRNSLKSSIDEFNKLIKKIENKIDAINVELSKGDISIDDNIACLEELKKYSQKLVDVKNDLKFFKDNLRKNEAMYEDKKYQLDRSSHMIRVLKARLRFVYYNYKNVSEEEFVFDEDEALLALRKSNNTKNNFSNTYIPYSNYNSQDAGSFDDDDEGEGFDRDVFDEEDLYGNGKSYDDEVLEMVLADEFDREMAESLGIDNDFAYYNASFGVGGYD